MTRRGISAAGRLCALALASFLAGAILFGHPLPALAAGLALGLLVLSLPGGRTLARLEFRGLRPVWMIEDETRLLELDYSLSALAPPLAVTVSARGPALALEGATPALASVALGRLPLRARALRRGHWERLTFDVTTGGPFGFMPRTRTFEVASDLWVLPRPRALRERVLEEMLALRPRGLDRPQPAGPGDGEFYALRDWREGEPERRVHARLSARRGAKVVRVFRGEAPPLVRLLVDPRVGKRGRAFGGGDFDEAMRFAAGVVRALLRRDVPVSLALVDGAGTPRVACEARCRDLHAFLAALAQARPIPVGAVAPTVPARADPRGGRSVVIHLGQTDEARLDPGFLAIRAGSQRYYQLLDMSAVEAAGAEESESPTQPEDSA